MLLTAAHRGRSTVIPILEKKKWKPKNTQLIMLKQGFKFKYLGSRVWIFNHYIIFLSIHRVSLQEPLRYPSLWMLKSLI